MLWRVEYKFYFDTEAVEAGFHLNECNNSAEAARIGACIVDSNVDSPLAAFGQFS